MSSQSSRRGKSGHSSNKNKLLRDEYRGSDNKDDMQLVSRPSYWMTNENVKRSQHKQLNPELDENAVFNPDLDMKDYLADAAVEQNAVADETTYFDDDDATDYDINGYFNSVNQDNINDFYFYINQLLNRKPNLKTI